ncbi:MAG: NAD(P)(+) transhydrogenase (Re/Si-specific) subunit beta, partial [Chitinophagales bacterium]|nr:NAD(P)(+) transhydrogenase (Re/Si-specific) subunit beta [Chitinophagales bacterium]
MKGILEISYLIGSVTFIVGLKMMGNAKTARKGNLIGAFGMGVAILGTIFLYEHEEGLTSREFFKLALIFGAIAIGTAIGWMTAKKVEMTKMPELVSMFNGMGGACAALIGLTEFPHVVHKIEATGEGYSSMAFIIAGMVIGPVSFSGSIIAYLKLAGKMNKPIRLPQYNMLNNALLLLVVVFSAYVVLQSTSLPPVIVWVLFAVAVVYGILFTIPIGGADMPVVISLLNS